MVLEYFKKKCMEKLIYLIFILECLKKKIKNEKNKFNVKKFLILLLGKEFVIYRWVDDVVFLFFKM